MNKRIKVFIKGRKLSIEHSKLLRNVPRIIISIHSTDDKKPKFDKTNESIYDILYLKFDDVLFDSNPPGKYAMNENDAKQIVEFVKKYENNKDLLVIEVHCDAGMSRSAGVGAAILKYLKGDDSEIFDNPYYHPNITCYRKVLEAFYN